MKKIVIFDSGVGGLSVYKEVSQALPESQYIYCFDNAAFPYGELQADVLIKRCALIVTHLVERFNADLVIIACNTASTIVLPTLREKLSIPVVGVVPAIKPAARLSEKKVIGLLATPATVERDYTKELIAEYAQDCEVLMLGSTRLVEMGEEKIRRQKIDIVELRAILQPWIGRVDCVVLGCTHFPLLREEITQVFADKVKVIDSGRAIARRVVQLLKDNVSTKGLGSEREDNLVFCSATPEDRVALELGLKGMNFSVMQEYSFPSL